MYIIIYILFYIYLLLDLYSKFCIKVNSTHYLKSYTATTLTLDGLITNCSESIDD